jgi:phosphatidylserine/phosphatidylglycerophosphate/cardiolipin synthase-like enzyme
MKLFITLAILTFSAGPRAQSIFIEEKGSYIYGQSSIVNNFKLNEMDYVSFKAKFNNPKLRYKLDPIRNEFQLKDYFTYDWYELQGMFGFDSLKFMETLKSRSFNEAKRKQYSGFVFNRDISAHRKSIPSLREWGGLTHPPVKELTMPLEKYDPNFAPVDYKNISSPYFSEVFQREVDAATRSELSFGNQVSALADGDVFRKKKELIANARESILMSSLVFVCDTGTRQIVDLLIQKHREGVEIKILVDGFISKLLNHRKCLKQMQATGIEVAQTVDFLKHKRNAIYHTKTLVIDLKLAMAGGHNMIDADNLSRGLDFKNRDVDLLIAGPMVTDVARQFLENWHYQMLLNEKLSHLKHLELQVSTRLKNERVRGRRGNHLYQKILGDVSTRMKGVCRFIKQAPYEDRHTIGKAYLKYLSQVSRHLVITDPVKSDSFVSSTTKLPWIEKGDNFEMYNLLHLKVQDLARAGKSIDYITTNINMAGNENVAILNERIKTQLARRQELAANLSLMQINFTNSYYGKPHYKNLLKDWYPYKKVHVWNHISFMHSKIFYFDRVAASVGSYNFQHNATDHAYESTVICLDEKLNRELDVILVEDMANSIPLIFSRAQ